MKCRAWGLVAGVGLALCALGCGRLGFEPIGDGGVAMDGSDGPAIDGPAADARPDGNALDSRGPGTARPIAPANGSVLSAVRPAFEFELGGSDAGRVEVCDDAACATVRETIEGASPLRAAATYAGSRGIALHWRVTPLAAGAPIGPPGPVWTFFVRVGAASIDSSLGQLLDVDGDHAFEVVVGAPSAGEVHVHRGTASGPATVASPVISGGASFGSAIAMAGDVDGDGLLEIVVGSPDEGRARWIELGPAGVVSERELVGSAADRFGAAVEGLGDVDRDGYADLAVGAPGARAVHVYRGSAAGPVEPALVLSGGAGFGETLAAGDFDGDGHADLAVGAPAAERVQTFHGGAGGLATVRTIELAGAAGSRFGAVLSGDADVSADGIGDLVVGSPGAGTAAVFLGSATGLAATPDYPLDEGVAGYGSAVAAALDVDLNGYDDVLVSDGAGRVWVYFAQSRGVGVVPGWSVEARAPTGTVRWGDALGGAADADGDGNGDVVVGDVMATTVACLLGSSGGLGRDVLLVGPGLGGVVARP